MRRLRTGFRGEHRAHAHAGSRMFGLVLRDGHGREVFFLLPDAIAAPFRVTLRLSRGSKGRW